MANHDLIRFIKEARRRGFDDLKIQEALLSNGWQLHKIEEGFAALKPSVHFKNKIELYLDSDVLKLLHKRAKRNMLTISEQIEDILRRSVINTQHTTHPKEKLDDMLVGLFSRKTRKKKH